MVRGCQKKIIYLKNTQSDIFEEAYFVIKENSFQNHQREKDMVKEANRILNESFEFEVKKTRCERILSFTKRHAITFTCGILIGIIIAYIF